MIACGSVLAGTCQKRKRSFVLSRATKARFHVYSTGKLGKKGSLRSLPVVGKVPLHEEAASDPAQTRLASFAEEAQVPFGIPSPTVFVSRPSIAPWLPGWMPGGRVVKAAVDIISLNYVVKTGLALQLCKPSA